MSFKLKGFVVFFKVLTCLLINYQDITVLHYKLKVTGEKRSSQLVSWIQLNIISITQLVD